MAVLGSIPTTTHGARSRENVIPEYRAWRKLCTSAGVTQKQEACPAQIYTPPVKEAVDSPTEYPTDPHIPEDKCIFQTLIKDHWSASISPSVNTHLIVHATQNSCLPQTDSLPACHVTFLC